MTAKLTPTATLQRKLDAVVKAAKAAETAAAELPVDTDPVFVDLHAAVRELHRTVEVRTAAFRTVLSEIGGDES